MLDNMNWLTLLTASVVLKAGGAVFRRRLLGRVNSADPNVSAAFFNLVAGVILLAVALVVGFEPFDIAALWIWIAINILAAVVADVLQFNALKHIGAGDFALIESTRVIWTVIGATLLLGEGLTGVQILGGLLVLGANILVLWPQRSHEAMSYLGLTLATSFAAIYGLATIVDRVLFQQVDVISYLAVALLVQGVILSLVYYRRMSRASELLNRQNLIPFLGDVLFFVPSIVLLLEAVKRTDNISLLSALLPLTIVLSVVLAALFLGERSFLKYKIVGAIIATAGVAVLAL